MASPPPLEQYIPTGCLILDQADSGVPPSIWDLPLLKTWHRIPHPYNLDVHSSTALPNQIQASVGFPPALQPYRSLFEHRWIDFELSDSLDGPSLAIVRVYILPDDVSRGAIERSDPGLRKSRSSLFSKLDFSRRTWDGESSTSRSPSPMPVPMPGDSTQPDGSEDEEDISLLEMFNTLPSPNPQLSLLDDPLARETMSTILSSSLPGLTTTLHAYQGRSAALMYQRELQPGQVLDPRLLEVIDQNGRTWYFDQVNGIGLRHPRYYEGVKGGILAEQMGAGKTLICLALILATKDQAAAIPEIYKGESAPTRPKVGSFAEMVAAAINRNSVPWKFYFEAYERAGIDYSRAVGDIKRNPAWYSIPSQPPRRQRRQAYIPLPPRKIWPSSASLIIVPPNLVDQWKGEVAKHTTGLKVLTR
jgi:hypothetical protein